MNYLCISVVIYFFNKKQMRNIYIMEPKYVLFPITQSSIGFYCIYTFYYVLIFTLTSNFCITPITCLHAVT